MKMSWKTLDGIASRLSYIVLGVWIIAGFLSVFLLLRIDSIIHVQLYDYGLQFSPDWANPYWATVDIVFVALALPMLLSAVVLGMMLVRSRNISLNFLAKKKPAPAKIRPQEVKRVQPKLQIGTAIQEDRLMSIGFGQESEPGKEAKGKPQMQEGTGLLISCPSCKRVFNRPLVMLDFSNGKTRLVNICPYCNHNLGETVETRRSDASAGWKHQTY
jgi:uncharacterized Zn-finger protein